MIQGISASDALFGATDPTNNDLDKGAFMKLLVAQLKNQDPLAPTDNQAFISQLAEFSSLEEMQGVNQNLVALALLQENNAMLGQLTDSSALIGKSVVFLDASGAEASGVVDAVKLTATGVLLSIGDQDVPLHSVQAVTAGDAEDDPDDDQDDA